MTNGPRKLAKIIFLAFSLVIASSLDSAAQTYNSNSGGYTTGFGTVYGSHGLAMATQNIYSSTQMSMRKTMARNAMIKKWGLAAVEKAEREYAARSRSGSAEPAPQSEQKIVVQPPPVVRDHGKFRPDPTVDTGKSFADALGETPEEKALIKQIYTAAKTAYESQAAQKGWKNNIAGGITFFTATAMTIYHDADEPSDEAVDNYYAAVNVALDETPEFAKVANRDKQHFNNMMIGFGGLLLAGYMEGKQNNDASAVATYRKLAGVLIEMVIKTDPEKLRIEGGQIVLK